MKLMSVREILEETLSTKMKKPNVVYRLNKECFGKNFRDLKKYHFQKGDLVCVSGCGELHKSGETQVFVDDYWVKVPNNCLTHYANPILERA